MATARIGAGRRGGRAARLRGAGAPREGPGPVRPGMEGGRLALLSASDMRRIHETALWLLAEVGVADALPSTVELVTARGGFLDGRGRLRLPRALVEEVIARARREVLLAARDPAWDLEPGGRRLYLATAGAAVEMVEEDGTLRPSTLADLVRIAAVADRLEHLHLFQRPVVCRDLDPERELDLHTLYACLWGTRKHVGCGFTSARSLERAFGLLHRLAGSEARWRARPFVSVPVCHVVPPLRCAPEACRVLETAVRGGMPVVLIAAGQAGATSPAALAGAVAQQVAESLFGLVYVHSIDPRAPAIFAPWPLVSDLRSGAMSGGGPEQALLMAAAAQMGRYYDLPTGVAAGMTDSKCDDYQAGMENALNHTLIAHSGANIIYEAAGMRASLLGFSLPGLLLDAELLGMVLRTVGGLEVEDASLSAEVVARVCLEGPGHFLDHPQTLELMHSGFLYPRFADRLAPDAWREAGRPTALERARRRLAALEAEPLSGCIPPDLHRELVEAFALRAPPGGWQRPRAGEAVPAPRSGSPVAPDAAEPEGSGAL